MSSKRGILDRLEAGEVILGDGGYVTELERRGYVIGGQWTPEVNVEHPDAVKQLHKEFQRAGSDVLQAFTFYAADDSHFPGISVDDINESACKIVKEVANEDNLICGSMSKTCAHKNKEGKEAVIAELKKQLNVFLKNDFDFLLAEYFCEIEEMEWAIELLKSTGKPVAATMHIGPLGDWTGVTTKECAVRMAKAGADIIGLNCCFDPDWCIEGIKMMKEALDEAGLKRHLMLQPLGYRTPDAGRDGYLSLPEYPFALEPRSLTRFDAHRYARNAYDAGVRYLGGCCGFESYHIRAVAEELSKERGRMPLASQKNIPWGGGCVLHTYDWMKKRDGRSYWENLVPHCGVAGGSCVSTADNPISPEFEKYKPANVK